MFWLDSYRPHEAQVIKKVNTYLNDITHFAEYDAIYREFFPSEPPARTTIGCQLKGIQVEIDCVAVAPAGPTK